MPYKLKVKIEDFIVEEIPDVTLLEEGKYTVFELEKKDTNTLDAIYYVAQRLKVEPERITFAGSKDKKAITRQWCSIQGDYRKWINSIESPHLKTSFKGYAQDPVHLGDLKGNRFQLMIRNIEHRPKPMMVFVNFFGEQRFGSHNAEIGKHLVRKDFEHAMLLLARTHTPFRESLNDYLIHHPRDYVGALRRIPLRLLKFFVHGYQSLLWNEVARALVAKKVVVSNIQVPLIGFGLSQKSKYRQYIDPILGREEIRTEDFIIKQLPELSAEGGYRRIFADVKRLELGECETDEVYPGKCKVRCSFELTRGSYATVFVHQLFTKFGEYKV
ncbi:tRNA pseudouridine(13) synthase TruD [Candidatus Woesearchaeota archaeon]|nr:tRNA pseudouridine(13) synthase TruD [Candidatus Woesearchaeota archaeon]